MSTAHNSLSIAFAILIVSAGAAFAQAGGGDVPTNAKKQGEMTQPGSTGMPQGEVKSMKKGGTMRKSGMMKKGGKM